MFMINLDDEQRHYFSNNLNQSHDLTLHFCWSMIISFSIEGCIHLLRQSLRAWGGAGWSANYDSLYIQNYFSSHTKILTRKGGGGQKS